MKRPDRPLGNPLVCARRVAAISSIVQDYGTYRVTDEARAERAFGAREVRLLERPPDVWLDGLTVTVILDFGFEARKGAADEVPSEPDVTVEARYRIVYQLEKGEEPNDADLAAFADVNGRLNLTPYWREYLQDSLARGGLPPFILPPFNAAARVAKRAQEQSARASDQQGDDSARSGSPRNSGSDSP